MSTDPRDRAAAAHVAQLREHRVRQRDLTIADAVERARRSVRSLSRAESEAARAWEQTLADDPAGGAFSDRLEFRSFSRGVLSLRAADSSAKYLGERWLRERGLAALRIEARIPLAKVRITL
ncbi:MAG: hypothetical protein ACF8Q5_10255 [Phycisphaerales bacterium JB040]